MKRRLELVPESKRGRPKSKVSMKVVTITLPTEHLRYLRLVAAEESLAKDKTVRYGEVLRRWVAEKIASLERS